MGLATSGESLSEPKFLAHQAGFAVFRTIDNYSLLARGTVAARKGKSLAIRRPGLASGEWNYKQQAANQFHKRSEREAAK